MNHLEYYRYYETLSNPASCSCADCNKDLTDDNCDFDVTDEETGEYVCDECAESLSEEK